MAQNSQKPQDPCTVLLRDARASYPHLLVPRSFGGGVGPADDAYYSIGLIIPKTEAQQLKAIEIALKTAAERAVASKFGGKLPAMSSLHRPIADGDAKDPDTGDFIKPGEEFRGCFVLNSKSKTRPAVVTRSKEPAVEEDIWPGQHVHALLKFAAYNFGGRRGISCYLNAVQLTGRGERIDGRMDADVFENLDNTDDYDDALLGAFGNAA